jgi:hypothetical protein
MSDVSKIRAQLLQQRFLDLQQLPVFRDFNWNPWVLDLDSDLPDKIEGRCFLKHQIIKLHLRPGFTLAEANETLVHEMTHALLGRGGHEKAFVRTMLTASYQAGVLSKATCLLLANSEYKLIERELNKAWAAFFRAQ